MAKLTVEPTPEAPPVVPQHLTEHPAYKAGYTAGTIRVAGVLGATQALMEKLEKVHRNEQYERIWRLAASHGLNYTGPQYVAELDALRAALAALKEKA